MAVILVLGTISALSAFGGPFKITVLNTHGTNMRLGNEFDLNVRSRENEVALAAGDAAST